MDRKIYIAIITLGGLFILISEMPLIPMLAVYEWSKHLNNPSLNNVVNTLGFGFFTSGLVALLIDVSNAKAVKKATNLMKRNIWESVEDLLKSGYFANRDLDFKKLDFLVKTDFLKELYDKCEYSLLLGIGFFDSEEMTALQNLKSICSTGFDTFGTDETKAFYELYSEVINVLHGLKFEHGPYSEEDTIRKALDTTKRNSDDITVCRIGEIMFLYQMLNLRIVEYYEMINSFLAKSKS